MKIDMRGACNNPQLLWLIGCLKQTLRAGSRGRGVASNIPTSILAILFESPHSSAHCHIVNAEMSANLRHGVGTG
jgi:hypothetical protein